MLAFRFCAGLGGSAMLALGGGILADTFHAEQRGKAVGLYSLAPLLGPAIGNTLLLLFFSSSNSHDLIGPIIGGFITENTTWRWVFWSTTIFCAAVQITGLILLQGTSNS